MCASCLRNRSKVSRCVLPSEHAERVGAVVLLREDGAALLQHRDDKPGLRHASMWVPPGGHAEAGETIVNCARRELREETGYDQADLHWLTAFEDREEGWPPYRLTVFWAWYDGLQPVQCREGQALEFIERANAGMYPIPDYLLEVWDLALKASKKES
ncbi:MAG TPA: NUDIX domain-containing protein [Nitrospirales bacterium]|nr:NUDIX domain-containing protein [Nitrospirales bacterium]HIN33705.1 NUDIX domain-containing protein [Nitrospirales bacterium]